MNGVQSALQNMWDTTNAATEAFLQNAGITNWGPYIFSRRSSMWSWRSSIGFAIFLIVLSKLFMWLLLALAPVFIILLLFGVTSRFFSGWLSAIAQYFVVQVLVYAFLAFYVSLIQQSIDALNGVANSEVCDLGDDRTGRPAGDHRHPALESRSTMLLRQSPAASRSRAPRVGAVARHRHRLSAWALPPTAPALRFAIR